MFSDHSKITILPDSLKQNKDRREMTHTKAVSIVDIVFRTVLDVVIARLSPILAEKNEAGQIQIRVNLNIMMGRI
jgi:hypothetical protein